MQNRTSSPIALAGLVTAGLLAACTASEPATPAGGDTTVTYPLSTKSGGGYATQSFAGATSKGAALAPNRSINGTLTDSDAELEGGGYADFHSYSGSTGELLRISLESGSMDTYLAVMHEIDGESVPIAYDDDSGEGFNSYVEVELPADGEYSILAWTAAEPRTGDYTIRMDREADVTFSGGGPTSGRYALLIGAGDYPAGTENDLSAVATDLVLMRTMLIDQLGFRDEDIVTLADARATSRGAVRGFREHLSQAGKDGAAVFYYSGHGLQIGENIGELDAETDGSDEALYMADASYLVDDDIAFLRDELTTDNVLVILDACHSGTASMVAGDIQIKEVRAEKLGVMLRDHNGILTKDIENALEKGALGTEQHVMFGSSRDIESSIALGDGSSLPESTSAAPVSLFTYCFVLAIGMEGTDASFDQILETTYGAMSEWLSMAGAEQQPQLLGSRSGESVASFLKTP